MSEPLSKIPSGMRYYFGREARLRRAVEDSVMTVFDGWSYEEITTPAVDYYALFERGMGRVEAHRAFRFTDTDGRLLALRPDVTSGVARAAATLLRERERPLRLCYAASVFRGRPQSHAQWRRESTQIGCELIGAGGGVADMEVLAVACEALDLIGLGSNYTITINHVEVFNGVADHLRLDGASREETRRLLDSRDGAALEEFLAPHTSPGERAAFTRLVELSGKCEVLDEAGRRITNASSSAALEALRNLWRVVEALGLADRFEIDLGDVSGLDYYTGLIFKIYVRGAGARVGSGGRYDRLTADFGRGEPAVGFVLDVDALTDLLARSDDRTLKVKSDREAASISNSDPVELFTEAAAKRAGGERVLVEASEVTAQCRN